ncbi:DUF2309 family protein [Bacillus sp. DNRA2]|uniref:DUF2309 domain-containing protein n=1 Tax=Bacillus sp. DNRA2 TaxID=2723053 RepID=UPI00145F3E8C|nr:putative inorganic carbon transporter subunit DabA [Bacillus sp. DNRA2]NMD69334.1 DUF2309 family protein [Bacillus sp. DNRA2]
MNTSLAKVLKWEKEPVEQNNDIYDLVKRASKVIVPLGPINKFAARNPWVGLEETPFEQVACRFKSTCDVDLLPNDSVLLAAWKNGEIHQEFLEMSLQQWLDFQKLELPRADAERFCRAGLNLENQSAKIKTSPDLKAIVKKLSRFQSQITKKQPVQTYSQRLENMNVEMTTKELNSHVIKWCKLFLDQSHAAWSMPGREEGFYQAWRRLVQYDPSLNKKQRNQLKNLQQEASDALKEALQALEIPNSEIQEYLEAHLLALPGWAGTMLWRSMESLQENSLLMDYLAVRITLEKLLVQPHLPMPKPSREQSVNLESLILSWEDWGNLPIRAWVELSAIEIKARLTLADRFDQVLRNRLWLEAWEKTYENQLMQTINSAKHSKIENEKQVKAQLVFCIDVRSEVFRRKLEAAGPFETLGTAGFFGLPIETSKLGSKHTHHSLPVMFKPQLKVIESSTEPEVKRYQQRKQAGHALRNTFKTMKQNLLSSMLLPEISGPWQSIQTLARSFTPRSAGHLSRKIREKYLNKPSTELSLEHNHTVEAELPIGFTEEQKVQYVQQALTMMGLTEHFAPLVVICGHGSHSKNNPYSSALDCGACGGASSGFNARVLASLCNLHAVRRSLERVGISIPQETVFAAAEHITSLDELRWLYVPPLSNKAKDSLELIKATLPYVRKEANTERIAMLPKVCADKIDPILEAERLASDWSEVRPEWGLARNASFIIGDRKLTKDCHLDGRAFLHNYNWQKDKNGAILEKIITGPTTVAQWINLQYYASTVAPHYYGSGNKVTQTVTSGIGVMQGNGSDLLSGLPWQSVMKSDQESYHAPLRLLVVIQAPKEYIVRVFDQVPDLKRKIQNGWLRLASIDADGNWISWS